MNVIKSFTFILALGVALAACSEGKNDILGTDEELTEGSLTKGAGGPNTVVSLSNQAGVSQDINEEVASAFAKALAAISRPRQSSESTRVMGNYSGYLVVDDSPPLDEVIQALGEEFPAIKATFHDYSDAGGVYLGGVLFYAGDVQSDILVAGNLKFAGAYGGYLEYDYFLIPTDNNGNIISIFAPCEIIYTITHRGDLTFRSGGNNFIINPYPVVVDINPVMLPSGEEIIVYVCDPDYSSSAQGF